MKDLSYFIFGRDNTVSSTILIENKYQNKIFTGGDMVSVNILKEVNRILDIVLEEEVSSFVNIYVNEGVYKTLQKGSYKRWIQNGLYPSGDEVEEDYLFELQYFSDRFSRVFQKVTILPHNMCRSDLEKKCASYTWASLKGGKKVNKSA